MKIFFLSALTFFSLTGFSQDDLLKMLDTVGTKDKALNRVTATFKDPKVINLQTAQTVGAGELNFNISHRFGSIGVASGGGVHTLYGWDAISDVRLGFDYGITRTLQVGVGQIGRAEALDGNIKWRFLEQTIDNKVPFTACLYGIASFTPEVESQLYSGADSTWVAQNKKNEFSHRLSYTTQLILSRKFGNRFSLDIAPGYTHRNYVLANLNTSNSAVDENDLLSVAVGARVKLTRSFSLLADYFYVNSN